MNKRIIENGILKIYSKNGIILIDAEDEKKLKGYKICAGRPKSNYIQVHAVNKITKKFYTLSRVLKNCTDENKVVDHKNRNTLDNRKCNLRICNNSENQMNRIKSKNKSSKFKGVYFHKTRKKWMARAKLKGKHYFLGYFESEIEAAKAYNKFAIKHYGEYALLNDI